MGFTGGHDSPLIGLRYLSMFLPAVAVLSVSIALNEQPIVRWDRFPLKYLPVALFLIPCVFHAAMLPTIAAIEGGLPWEPWLTPQADGLYHTPTSRGWGIVTIQELIGHIVLNAIVGLVIASFLSFFHCCPK